MKRVAAAVLLVARAVAAEPAVDVQDLPPLPRAAAAPSSAAVVVAATAAEEEVVVGAAKREQSLGNVASAVTVVTADRIRRFGYRTVGEAVAGVAGVYLVDNRLSYAIGIRGLQVPGDFNTRILVLVDGASINETWGAYAGLGFDAIVGIDEIARIEVIRGPVSSVYGTNAFFGIVNIVTRGAAESSRVWARTGVHSITGSVTSAGFAVGGVDRQVRGAVQFAERIGEDTIALPDGGDTHRGGDDSRNFTASVVGVYDGSFAQVRAVRSDRESPFAPYEVNPAFQPYDQRNEQVLVEGGHTRDVAGSVLAGRAYANLYRFTDTAPPSDPATEFALDSTGTAQTYGAEVRGRRTLIAGERVDPLGLTAGTEVSYSRTRSTAFTRDRPDELVADVPKSFSLQGFYTELDGQPLDWFGFVGGLRYDRHSLLADKLSPRAALFFAKPERYGAKLLYAEGFRNASAYEGFFFDDRDFVAADDLAPETIRSFEAVLWAKPLPGLSTRVSGFYWDARDIIEALAAPASPDALQFQNTTRYVSAGAEVEASYRNAAGWFGFAGLALTRVGVEQAGAIAYGDVTNAPVVTASLGVSTPKLFGIAHVSSETIVLGARPTRPGEDGPSPDAPVWVGQHVTVYAPGIRGFDISLGIRNLIGKRDLVPTPGDYDRSVLEERLVPRVPGEGREVFLKAGYAY